MSTEDEIAVVDEEVEPIFCARIRGKPHESLKRHESTGQLYHSNIQVKMSTMAARS